MTRYFLPVLFFCLLWLAACANGQPTPEPTEVVSVVENGEETAVSPTSVPTISPTSNLAPSATPKPINTPTETATMTPSPQPTTSIWTTMPAPAVDFETEIAFEVVNQIGGRLTAVQISGNHAYLGVGPRLVVLDVSDASQPNIMGQSDILPGLVQDIALVDDNAYVSTGENGFWIIDVSHPDAPQIVSFEPQSSTVEHLEIQNDHLFLLGKKEGESLENELVIYSVVEPKNPAEISRLSLPIQFYGDLILADELVFVTGMSSPDLHVIDVSQLDQPFVKETIAVADNRVKTFSNNMLYSLENGELQILDVVDSQHSTESVQIEKLVDAYWETDKIMVLEDYLFVSTWYCDQSPCGANLMVFNIADPTQTEEIANIYLDGAVVDLQIANGMMHVLTGSQLLITEMPQLASWVELGRFNGYGSYGAFSRLAAADEQLYVVDMMGHGVTIFSLAEPQQPVRAGKYGGAFDDIAAGNNQMYPSAGWQEGLHQVNTQNPGLPRRVSVMGEYASVDGSILEDTRLYALFNGYLGILDVANASEMNLLNDLNFNPEEYGPFRVISVSDGVVYAIGHQGISLLDASDPDAVVEIGFIPRIDAMCTLTARDGYVFVYSSSHCDYDSENKRLTIYDASNPASIQSSSSLALDFDVETMLMKGNNLYLIGDDLKVVDVSQPNSPHFNGFFPTPGEAHAASTYDDLIYVADGAGGVLVLRLTEQ